MRSNEHPKASVGLDNGSGADAGSAIIYATSIARTVANTNEVASRFYTVLYQFNGESRLVYCPDMALTNVAWTVDQVALYRQFHQLVFHSLHE